MATVTSATVTSATVTSATVMSATVIHVVGVGLSGTSSLSAAVLAVVKSAQLLIGAQRLIDTVVDEVEAESVETWVLGNFSQVFDKLRSRLTSDPALRVVILATGDPLFFGIGRLLLSTFPAEQLAFYPQVSSMQLAFSRLKVPWQDATLVSVHGRGEALLTRALKRGDRKIAVLTDGTLTPSAISKIIHALELPISYRLWVAENLGGEGEQLSEYPATEVPIRAFSALNVVVLLRQSDDESQPTQAPVQNLPLIGLPDSAFQGYEDRPLLITKREIRLLVLGAIAPLDHSVIWDIGAGTGSVSVELSRLCPQSHIYAIEKTAMGAALIASNAERLAIAPITVVQGKAPDAFTGLPLPHRVFIGGSSGQLTNILDTLHKRFAATGPASPHDPPRIVLALATLEHLTTVVRWSNQAQICNHWQVQLTQVNIARSLPVGPLTRFSPLNPITLITLIKTVLLT
ncbi:MAG: precorrin-6y C5,15-methyltransferase (decarboxylating) subunit CbiE [Cyanobacteria bacterium J06560_2]